MTRDEWDNLTPDERWYEYLEMHPIPNDIGGADGVDGYRAYKKSQFVDDNGNPCPTSMIGNMKPRWYDGRWWGDWKSYTDRMRELGDL